MPLPRRLILVPGVVAGLLAGSVLPGPPAGAVTYGNPPARQVVSVVNGAPARQAGDEIHNRTDPQSVSGDGRLVAFVTPVSGPGDDDVDGDDVYVRDRRTGTTELVSRPTTGPANGGVAWSPSISSDGRYVAFASTAPGLVPGDGTEADVFVRDRRTATTVRVSRTSGGGTTPGTIGFAQISADGRVVMWFGSGGLYVRTLTSATITQFTPAEVTEASLSGDGAYVAYVYATASSPVWRGNVAEGTAQIVSQTDGGVAHAATDPSISYTGDVVAFIADSPALDDQILGRTGPNNVYLWNASSGAGWRADNARSLVLAGDGRSYTYTTATAASSEDTDDGADDVYVNPEAFAPGYAQLLTGDLPPSPRGSGRPPWFAEISADGQIATVVSAAPLDGAGATPGPKRWSVQSRRWTDTQLDDHVRYWFPRLFGRAPTAAEVTSRRNLVKGGSRTLPEVVIEDLDRESFSGTRAGVVRLYQAYFLRPPDTAGYDYWVAQRRAGKSIHDISRAFAASPEFRTLYGPLTDAGFVDLVYANVLGRGADPAGAAYWTEQLRTGAKNRGQVMTGFSEAPENKARTRDQVVTTMFHRAVAGAAPTVAQLALWANEWRVGVPVTSRILEELID